MKRGWTLPRSGHRTPTVTKDEKWVVEYRKQGSPVHRVTQDTERMSSSRRGVGPYVRSLQTRSQGRIQSRKHIRGLPLYFSFRVQTWSRDMRV